jgi:hypothetical protein
MQRSRTSRASIAVPCRGAADNGAIPVAMGYAEPVKGIVALTYLCIAGCGRVGFDLLSDGNTSTGDVRGDLLGNRVISLDSATDWGPFQGVSTFTVPVSIPDAGRLLLFAVVTEGDVNPPVTAIAVSFRGSAMTLIRRDSTVNRNDATWWHLRDPLSGSGSAMVTLDGIPPFDIGGVAIVLDGVDLANPVEDHAGVINSTMTSITTVTDGAWVFDLEVNTNDDSSPCSGQTQLWNVPTGSAQPEGTATGPISPPGTVTVCWTDVGGSKLISALAVKPS